MIKQKIFVPILIVIVVIILIVSYNILFKLEKKISNKAVENITTPMVTRVPVTPAIEADYDELMLEELNNAPKAEYKYTLSTGEEVTIKIPRGVDPPPQVVVERMYQRRR